jgi:Uma2 family endonuclease
MPRPETNVLTARRPAREICDRQLGPGPRVDHPGVDFIDTGNRDVSTDAIHSPNEPLLDASPIPRSKRGDWTWELVQAFPRQGRWTEQAYLSLLDDVRAELVRGCLEFLPMPTWVHAWIVIWLHDELRSVVRARQCGYTAVAPIRVRTVGESIREPDVVWVSVEQLPDPMRPSNGAQLVMEVVSEGAASRQRDGDEKRSEYAQAGIPEYWIVDPETETITVLTLPANATEYAVHGEFKPGQTATSKLLDGFNVDVSACFAAGKGEAT